MQQPQPHLLSLIHLFVVLLAILPLCQASCGPRVRKEWREMTYTEQQLYLDALQALKTSGTFDTYPPDHSTYSATAHGNLRFLPWHRLYLLDFENALRNQGPPYDCVTLPYWDWTRDSGTSVQQYASSLFNSNAFGDGLGSPGTGCVQDGVAQGWNIGGGGGGCLTRRQTASGLTFSTQAYMEGLVTGNPVFSTFANILEGGPHGTPHVFVGGQMGLVSASPEDPLFWLHHNMVDMTWALWQVCHGYDNVHPNNIDGHPSWQGLASLDVDLPPFATPPRATHRLTDLGYAFGWDRGSGLAEYVRNSGGCGGHLTHTTWFYDPPRPCDYDTCSSCTAVGYGWCKHPLGAYCSSTQGSCPSWYWYNPTSTWGRTCRGWIIAWPIKAVELAKSITVLRKAVQPSTKPVRSDLDVAYDLQCYLNKEVTQRHMYDTERCGAGTNVKDPTLERWFEDSGNKVALEQLHNGEFDPFCGKHEPSPDYCPTQFPGGSLLGSVARIQVDTDGGSYSFEKTVSIDKVELASFRTKAADEIPLSVDISTNNIRVVGTANTQSPTTIRVEVKPRCGSTGIEEYTAHYENEDDDSYSNTNNAVVRVDKKANLVEFTYQNGFTDSDAVNVMLYFVPVKDILY